MEIQKMDDFNKTREYFISTQEDFVVDDLQRLLRRVNTCEKRYKAILESSSLGVQVIDIYGKINYINNSQCKILRYTTAGLEGKYIWELLASEKDREGLTDYLTKLAKKGYSPYPWIAKYVTKDNKIEKLQLNWNCMRDEQKNVIGFVSFTTRISETGDNKVTVNSLQIIAASKDEPPFDVGGIAFEQDTFLIMGRDRIDYPSESFEQLISRMHETPSLTLGSVLIRGKQPFRFLAVVHDVNQVPTWKEEWVNSALDSIFQECERLEIESVAVPLIGTLHGTLGKQRFTVMLKSAIERASFEHLKNLWLIIPVGDGFERYIEILADTDE
ncbi:MAG: PAS domain S-box protein [Desulfobacteraceae bacterium]|nr:PAS domain S-box protein [Desulfobacteraceae bacterium]